MIFIVKGEADNSKAIRWLLKTFELVSGLSVKYEKCWAYGINLNEDELLDLARIFGCRIGSFPIPYLGLKVGANLRMADGWQDILHKLEKRIKKWDIKTLLLAGRITIIRSVLTAIPIYALSLMPIPKNVYNSINRLFRDFLWGSQGETRKIAWIKWDDLSLPKTEGGLGFINLLSFNNALLCKWVWRFLSTEDSLWKRLIISRHGEPPWLKNGVIKAHYRKPSSGWWRKIISLVDGDRGDWFWSLLCRHLGDGKNTSFWDGAWLGCNTLRTQFPRLFHLSTNKDASVRDMGDWEDGVWKWKLNWRRTLRLSESAWETDLLERLTTQPSVTSSPDTWAWSRKPSNTSSVRHMYLELEKVRCSSSRPRLQQQASNTRSRIPHQVFKLIWSSFAPHKAQTLSWRLCKNRLPTLDNLHKRIALHGTLNSCCFCKEQEESCSHLFLDCKKVRMVWDNIVSWIGISWVAPNTPYDHLQSFSFLNGCNNFSKKLSSLWICIVWVWWRWRNEITFDKKVLNIRRIIDEIKGRFWSWCIARGEAEVELNFDSWKIAPNLCS